MSTADELATMLAPHAATLSAAAGVSHASLVDALVTVLVNQTAGSVSGNYSCGCTLILPANVSAASALPNMSTTTATETSEGAPSPPTISDLPDAGWNMLSIGTLSVLAVFLFACVCVLRGTASLPRPARKLLMVVDG